MTTASEVETLLADIRACRACAHEFPHTPRPVVWVFPETRLLICGQAPGRRVHESGRPFTDPSGDRLRDWMGIDEATFYGDQRLGVAPQAFCYPGTKLQKNGKSGGDYPPPPRCAALWREKLFSTLPKQKLILMVGSYSINWFLKDRAKENMTETVRSWNEYGPQLMPLPHPSWRVTGWMKRNPWFEAEMLPRLKMRVSEILN